MKDIPVTVRARSLAARAFVGCDLLIAAGIWEVIDLRQCKRFAAANSPRPGIDYLPGEYVERWAV